MEQKTLWHSTLGVWCDGTAPRIYAYPALQHKMNFLLWVKLGSLSVVRIGYS